MPTAVLQIHDTGLRVALDGELAASPPPSPGFALLDGDEVEVGLAAARRSRLKPRRVHNRFWEQLGTSALERPFPRTLSAADLAFAHLTRVWQPFGDRATEVIVVVPPWYDQQQLGLVLSLARAALIPVTCMIGAAAAACASLARLDLEGGRATPDMTGVVYLDLYLHRAVAERLAPPAAERQLAQREDVGLLGVLDSVAKEAAEVFVRRTRFDPLHGAVAEQRLYDLLPGWLERLRTVETVVASLDSGTTEHVVELTRAALLPRLEPVYRRLLELAVGLVREGDAVVASHRLATLPGFERRLEEALSRRPITLPPGAAVAGALAAREQIEAARRRHTDVEAVPLVTDLFLDESGPASDGLSAERSMTTASEGGSIPTHLLYRGQARRITEDPLSIFSAALAGDGGQQSNRRTLVVDDAGLAPCHCTLVRRHGRVLLEIHGSHAALLNDRQVDGLTECRVGDRLRFGAAGAELELIEVENE